MDGRQKLSKIDSANLKLLVKLIAITGPTASGKSSLANSLLEQLGNDNCTIIHQDNYYKDWSHLAKKDRARINFDDISSFDFRLFFRHLQILRSGGSIEMPLYDFVSHRRIKNVQKIESKQFVIVEGLMPYIKSYLSEIFRMRVYIDTDIGICLARRIKRDIKERGETVESVCKRYFQDVLPMQKKYVEPQKKIADFIIKGDRKFNSAVSELYNLLVDCKTK